MNRIEREQIGRLKMKPRDESSLLEQQEAREAQATPLSSRTTQCIGKSCFIGIAMVFAGASQGLTQHCAGCRRTKQQLQVPKCVMEAQYGRCHTRNRDPEQAVVMALHLVKVQRFIRVSDTSEKRAVEALTRQK